MAEEHWSGEVRAARLQGLAAILVLGWGAWQGLSAIATPEAQQRLRETLNWEAFLQGRTAAAVNHVMAHSLPADPWLRAAGGVLRWRLFGSGGPQVRAGCEDWLYLTEELRPWQGAEAAMAERAAALGRIAARLRQRGIALLVAVTPDKAAVHGEQLCDAPLSAQAAARHAEFGVLLRRYGVEPVDWLGLLLEAKQQGAVYYRTDTHWNQRGAALAAQAIAAAAQAVPLSRADRFETRRAEAESEGPGDLLRLMSLDRMPDWLRPAPDRQYLETTLALDGAGGGAGLLDEVAGPEVALIGSSYSVNANFHGRLQQTLRSRVANFGQAGGGFAGSARAYFGSPAWRDSPPKLVVWEVLGRALGQPIGEEERAFLAGW